MLTGHDTARFPGLLASLLLDEAGVVPFPGIVPREAVLARHGATDLFVEALRRGISCGSDAFDLDFVTLADRPLIEMRRDLDVPAPPDGPFTFTI